uniref:Glycosyltransferase n=1 Tax=Camellia fraterna TaxID=542725 RepID=A0A4P9I902_9ERIC|nr:UDP-glycosyltransferase [Camellia fraterna]
MGGSSETQILVLPSPIHGHINPMLQFSKRLSSKGLNITLITTTSISTTLQLNLHPTSTSTPIKTVSISDGTDKKDHSESYEAEILRFKTAVSQTLAQLIQTQLTTSSGTKVLVYDSVIPWALDIAHKFGLRGACFFTQPCGVCAIYYHLHEGEFKVPLDLDQSGVVSLPSLPGIGFDDLPSFVSDMGSYPGMLGLLVNQFSNFRKADWILFNTFDKLEEKIVKWMASQWSSIKTIGPTIPSKFLDKRLEDDKDYGLSLFKPNAEAWMKRLDTKPKASVVYASFGSLASLSQAQMEEIAWGLKNSNYYFLWVVRSSEQGKLPSNCIDETSSEKKGLIVNWCSQLQVLAHQAVGCFMTHCGWNSTLEALSLGVPMVAMPQWSDQTTNTKFVVALWRTGVRVKVNDKGIIGKEEIETRIREVMEGETGSELRKNAVRWKELAKEAVDEGGSSDTNIQEFVSEILNT